VPLEVGVGLMSCYAIGRCLRIVAKDQYEDATILEGSLGRLWRKRGCILGRKLGKTLGEVIVLHTKNNKSILSSTLINDIIAS